MIGIWLSCNAPPISLGEGTESSNCLAKKWFPHPPPSDDHYQGVGSASFIENMETTKNRAKQNAYLDLASSIVVSVKGTVVDSVWEDMGISGEFIKQIVETSVKEQHLNDIEVVDICIQKPYSEVYVYVRLRKQLYEERQRQQREMALQNSLRYYSEGNFEFAKNNYKYALRKFLTAYYYSRFLLGTLLLQVEYPEYSGKMIYLDSEISKKIEDLLAGIILEEVETPSEIKAYRTGNISLEVRARFEHPGRYSRDMEGIPLIFMDENNSVGLEPLAITNRFGNAKSFIKNVNPKAEIAIINCQLALDSIYIERENIEELLPVVYSRVFVPPFTKIEIPIRPLYIYFEGSETIDDKEVMESEKFVSRAIQEFMIRVGGFAIVDTPEKADLIIEIDANCKHEMFQHNLYWYSAYISANIKKVDTKEVIYSNVFEPVQDFGINPRQAGISTLEKAGIIMREKIATQIIGFLTSQETGVNK